MPLKPPPAPLLAPPLGERDHALGPADAPLQLVEFGDYQCPHCAAALPAVEEIRRRLGDRLRFAFRHFPLIRAHPQARLEAEAAEAAGAAGKFWEMHHLLFARAREIDTDHAAQRLAALGRELGLDADRLAADLRAGTYGARVREDLASGMKSGVRATPTFFINGRPHAGAYAADALLAALQAALEAPGNAPPAKESRPAK